MLQRCKRFYISLIELKSEDEEKDKSEDGQVRGKMLH
jgi:hypothetical protein